MSFAPPAGEARAPPAALTVVCTIDSDGTAWVAAALKTGGEAFGYCSAAH